MTQTSPLDARPDAAKLRRLYERSNGKAFEPAVSFDHPWLKTLIEDGFLRRCTMRCGFEAFDTGVDWTPAAHAALHPGDPS